MNNLNPRLLPERDAARYLGVGESTLRRVRYGGTGPQHVRIGSGRGRVLYDIVELDRFVDAHLQK
jgi:predicted DNA-binding transcriptional regulator AlpA